MSATATTQTTNCPVTDGMYVRPSTTLRLDAIATAYGQCQIVVMDCTGASCVCVPSSTIYERVLGHIYSWVDITSQYQNGTFAVGRVYGKGPNGTTAFLHVLDTTQPNTTGPLSFRIPYPGEYSLHFQGNINTTPCNILPNVTPQVDIMVHARTTLHRGERTNGSLIGAASLPDSGPGYYHYLGNDQVDKDDWGGVESTKRLIETVGIQWAQNHPTPRFGYGDISRQNGGPFLNPQTGAPEHIEHQNGLDFDVRYVGKEVTPGNNYEGPINLMDAYDLTNRYDRARTIELLNLLAVNASLYRIIVDPNAGISSVDVPNTRIDIDTTGGHRHHFHVSLNDPDGPDTNNCP